MGAPGLPSSPNEFHGECVAALFIIGLGIGIRSRRTKPCQGTVDTIGYDW